MNGTDFYHFVRNAARDNPDVDFRHYVNPLNNHPERFPDSQFVTPDGRIIAPWVHTGENCVFPDPLAGPFYRLEVQSLVLYHAHLWYGEGNYCALSTIVACSDGSTLESAPIIGINSGAGLLRRLIKEALTERGYVVKDEYEQGSIPDWLRAGRAKTAAKQ